MSTATGTAHPRWDGQCVLFDIQSGEETVPCAISRQALQDLSSRRHFKPALLLVCFAESRARIEAIARRKLARRSPGVFGRLSIWSDDVGDAAPEDVPKAARANVAPG
jgi:hypothetical protein